MSILLQINRGCVEWEADAIFSETCLRYFAIEFLCAVGNTTFDLGKNKKV